MRHHLSGHTFEEYKGRGVCVPIGQKASWIMEGAKVLQEQYDVPPYEARDMVASVLAVILPAIREDDRPQDPDKAETEKVRDATLKNMLNTPPKPHKDEPKRGKDSDKG